MKHYGSWEGADLAMELIWEEMQERLYTFRGPAAVYGGDGWRELDQEEREMLLEEYESIQIDDEAKEHARAEYYGLKIAYDLCRKAANLCIDDVSKTVGQRVGPKR